MLLTDALTTDQDTVLYYGQYGARGADLPLWYALRDLKNTSTGAEVSHRVQNWLKNIPVTGTSDWLVCVKMKFISRV